MSAVNKISFRTVHSLIVANVMLLSVYLKEKNAFKRTGNA